MSHPRILVLVASALLGACSAKAPPPPPPAPPPPATAEAATPEAVPTTPAEPEFVYSGAGQRDPFRSYLSELARESNAFASRCQGPLGKFELEQYRLVAVITGLEDPVAMVEPPGGTGYVVRRGACIGKNGGVVAAVRSGGVVVTEWRVRADGSRDPIQTQLQLPKPPEMNPEE